MQLLSLTLPTPAENIALDEALLDDADAGTSTEECLRLWESPTYAAVLGRASSVVVEANTENCAHFSVPIVRRRSGGAAVVIGPGCLMYTLVLSLEKRPPMRMIDRAHQTILGVMANALGTLANDVQVAGTSDLTLNGQLKFSGNSLRVGRNHLLYHGTILYDFDLPMIGQILKTPPRQPDYREGREHCAFVTNFPASVAQISQALTHAWQAEDSMVNWPSEATQDLVVQRYSQDTWNFQR